MENNAMKMFANIRAKEKIKFCHTKIFIKSAEMKC